MINWMSVGFVESGQLEDAGRQSAKYVPLTAWTINQDRHSHMYQRRASERPCVMLNA